MGGATVTRSSSNGHHWPGPVADDSYDEFVYDLRKITSTGGRLGDGKEGCVCSAAEVDRYAKKMSGPVADRIDMHVTVGRVRLTELSVGSNEESSIDIRRRVCIARARQNARYARMLAPLLVSYVGLVSEGPDADTHRLLLLREQDTGRPKAACLMGVSSQRKPAPHALRHAAALHRS